jgi:hypothetical protein
VILAMLAVVSYQTWILQPEIDRHALRIAREPPSNPQLDPLLRRQRRWVRLNLVLSIAVLALTALARTV